VCNRGSILPTDLEERVLQPTILQRLASAFAVLCGQSGDVTKRAQDREQSRPSLSREAEHIVDAVDGTVAQSRVTELQQRVARQQAEIPALHERMKHAVEITSDQPHKVAPVAQAAVVSLSVARRQLPVVAGPKTTPGVPALGRVTRAAGQRAGRWLKGCDETAQPEVNQVAAAKIFCADDWSGGSSNPGAWAGSRGGWSRPATGPRGLSSCRVRTVNPS
jgi:hypothetical protein